MSLSTAEGTYAKTSREGLAAICMVLLLRPSLEGTCFSTRTHHKLLKCILNIEISTAKLTQWRLTLYGMEFDIVHRVGIGRQAARLLLQLRTSEEDGNSIYNADALASGMSTQHRKMIGKDTTDPTMLSTTAFILALVPSPGTTRRMSNSDLNG